jgi:uncharacterized protein (TIRG00374 family)
MKKRLLIIVMIAIAFYLGIIIYSNLWDVLGAFKLFKWYLLPIILSLIFIEYLIRSIRWNYYLDELKISIQRKRSYLIFFTGLSMSITPGKVGELIKAFLLKDECGTPMSKGTSIVFIERITDVIGICGLAIIGLFSVSYGMNSILIVTAIFILFVLVIQNRKLSGKLVKVIGKIPLIRRYKKDIDAVYETSHDLLQPKNLMVGVGFGFISWSLECICLYLISFGFGIHLGLFESVFIVSFSLIIGNISMLPGGLGITEGSMLGILLTLNVSSVMAVAVVILFRLVTLWFAVIIGLVAMSILLKKKRMEDE